MRWLWWENWTFFHRLQIKQSTKGIFISQSKYALELTEKYWLDNAKDSKIPMNTTCKLDKNGEGTPVEQRLYRNMIWSVIYLSASRPDIMLSVWLCVRFQPYPMESQLKEVKKIIKSVEHTSNFGLWYPKQTHFDLCVHTNSNFVRSKNGKKSTSGVCLFLGSWFVSSMCKK